MIKFETAEEARKELDSLHRDLLRIPYNRDLHTIANNLSGMVDKLSQLEVYKRRCAPRSRYHLGFNRVKNELIGAMDHLEKLMLMARLMA